MYRMTLGKIASRMELYEEAVNQLRQALAVLEITHQDHKDFIMTLKDNLYSCTESLKNKKEEEE